MAPQPQRRTDAQRKTLLDASVAPVERALLHRASEIEAMKDELPVGSAQRFFVVGMAAEFRMLAEELHYW